MFIVVEITLNFDANCSAFLSEAVSYRTVRSLDVTQCPSQWLLRGMRRMHETCLFYQVVFIVILIAVYISLRTCYILQSNLICTRTKTFNHSRQINTRIRTGLSIIEFLFLKKRHLNH